MVTITRISNVNYDDYDEVWAIVRSLKYGNPRLKHVPELAPSWSLFKTYMELRKSGQWNEETFKSVYVPQFLKEMRGKKQQALMNELFATKKHICLVCYCTEEEMCHRSIIGGMLQGAGAKVRGLSQDYGFYFNQYRLSLMDKVAQKMEPVAIKNIADYNSNVVRLYEGQSTKLFDDGVPTLNATGRRPKDLCMYDTAKYKDFASSLAELLYNKFYVERGVRRFISGAAQGFDQLFFWAVERMKKIHGCADVQNIVFTAFEGQEARWAGSGCFSQAEYWMMIKNADMVVIVSEENSVEALFARNHAMCDNASYCLGLYPDDGWKASKGGTAECLRYAAKAGLETFRLPYEIDEAGLHMKDMLIV